MDSDEIVARSLNTPDADQVSVTKITLDRIIKGENAADALALYLFYAYTAKWQDTNQIKCTVAYVSKAFEWGENRVRLAKKTLSDLGLVEDWIKKDPSSHRVEGWFIRVFYLTSGNQYFTKEKPPSLISTPWNSPPDGEQIPKCLGTGTSKCLGTNNKKGQDLVFEEKEYAKPPWGDLENL